MVAPPPARHSAVVPCFYGSLGFLHKHSRLPISSLPSPQAVSSQPTAVLPPGLLSNPHVPALSPRVHRQTHAPVWGTHACGTDRLCRSHSVPSATDQPFHPPLTASDAPLLSQVILPSVRGLPWMREPLCFSFPEGHRSCPTFCPLIFPFFLSSYPVMQASFLSFLVSEVFC